jgi:membrane-bound metal-dependent hydrolase YbcI (DUF457 family)
VGKGRGIAEEGQFRNFRGSLAVWLRILLDRMLIQKPVLLWGRLFLRPRVRFRLGCDAKSVQIPLLLSGMMSDGSTSFSSE